MIFKMLILFVLLYFFFKGYSKSVNELYLIIFLLPYDLVGFRGINISQFAIFAYYIGGLLNRQDKKRTLLKSKYTQYVKVLVLLFLSGIVIFYTKGIYSDYLLEGQSTPSAVRNYIFNFISSILLYIVIQININTFKQVQKSIEAFILSISYLFITWFFDFLLNLYVPEFLRTVYVGGTRLAYNLVPTFSGYNGEAGLIMEYTMFILAFSFFMYVTTKKSKIKIVFLLVMIISILMAMSTFMKTYYFGLIIFMLTLAHFFMREKNINPKRKNTIILLIVVIVGFVFVRASNSYIVERFDRQLERSESIGRYDSKFDVMIHRPYVREFNNFWEECGLFGIGTINALGIRGNHLATHSHYYDLFMKYGLIGLAIYSLFYFQLLRGLIKLTHDKYKVSYHGKILIYVLFSLLLSLLIIEYSRSYQNQTSYMLNYWFLFSMIVVILTKSHIIRESCHTSSLKSPE
jgi:hypothetical protein